MAAFSDTAFNDAASFSTSAFSFGVAPPTPALPNPPGRVFKGVYPYWRDRREPYWEIEESRDEEEMLAMMGIDL